MPTRIARGSGPELKAELEDPEGGPVAGKTVSISVSNSRGDELDAGTAVEDSDSPGTYRFDLAPSATTEIDRLTADWSWNTGAVSSTHDVVGCHFHNIGPLRTLDPLEDEGTYPTPLLVELRDLAAYALETACRVAFCERFSLYEGLSDGGVVLLPKVGVRRVLWARADGEDLDLADLELGSGGALAGITGCGAQLEIGFVHALTEVPPARVARASQLLVREIAFSEESGTPDRATTLSSQDGTFSLVTAGVGGAAFDIPEVNAVVKEFKAYGPISRD